jgi:hypothetical protein
MFTRILPSTVVIGVTQRGALRENCRAGGYQYSFAGFHGDMMPTYS